MIAYKHDFGSVESVVFTVISLTPLYPTINLSSEEFLEVGLMFFCDFLNLFLSASDETSLMTIGQGTNL